MFILSGKCYHYSHDGAFLRVSVGSHEFRPRFIVVMFPKTHGISVTLLVLNLIKYLPYCNADGLSSC